MVYLNMKGFWGWPLVLGLTIYTYLKYDQFKTFSANKCQKFGRTARTLWSVMVPYNTLKGFPSVPCWRGYFLAIKIRGFQWTGAIKHQWRLCRILGVANFVAAGIIRLQSYNANGGGGEDFWSRTSWGIRRWRKRWEKRAPAGWSSVRYCACSCYENCLYWFPPFPSPPCMVESTVNRGSRRSVTRSVTPRMGLSVTTIGRIWAYLTRCSFK